MRMYFEIINKYLWIILILLFMNTKTLANIDDGKIYQNQFAVHISGGKNIADSIATKHGFINLGQIGSLDDHYLFEHNHVHKRSLTSSVKHHSYLKSEPEVRWVEQQFEKRRKKRDIHSAIPSDPLFKSQWFLNHGAKDGSDMNVQGAWNLGATGKGVAVSILDDGIQYNHPDLKQNYDPEASTDINGNDNDPMPQDNGDNKHGTRCAGEVAAVAFNKYCGVGIAYNASIGGVRMLDGVVNDAVEARALSLNPEHIDIYSASWGPEDDGKTVDGPGPLAKKAFINGIKNGRNGKGSIFVWASGNGGRKTDNCNCDGYTNSIFTLSISSATQGGFKPWYLEQCSSTLATTYSSGTPSHDASIVTVDQDARLRPDHICTSSHTGTSASAPIAAGVCALALEVNPNLTWRDMQHIVVRTSNPKPLLHETGWSTNGVGRQFSHKFGYGLMDATAMVQLAKKWKNSNEQLRCETETEKSTMKISASYLTVTKTYLSYNGGCSGTSNVNVSFLEHVQCKVSLKFNPRGALQVTLTSPSGTKSELLMARPRDKSDMGFEDWAFLSVHFWGENPKGEWTLEISRNKDIKSFSKADGVLKHWQLIFYGTQNDPFPSEKEDLFDISNDEESEPVSIDESTSHSNIVSDGPLPRPKYPTNAVDLSADRKCDIECLEGCANETPQGCKACRNYLFNNTCVKDCPLGTYKTADMQCFPCHKNCPSCFGKYNGNCLSCKESLYFVPEEGRCFYNHCPTGYRTNNKNEKMFFSFPSDNVIGASKKFCVACPDYCKSCTSSSSTSEVCLSCADGLFLHEENCVASCPKSYFSNKQTGACEACHSSCATCIGALPSQCSICQQGLYYFQRNCIESCPKGYHPEQSISECIPCPIGCAVCSDKGNCVKCERDWKLMSDSRGCTPNKNDHCKDGQFRDKLGKCSQCHSTCKTCSASGTENCLSCREDHLLHIQSCVDMCPESTFKNGLECRHCPHACRNCDSIKKCTSCQPGYFLFQGQCLASCEDGYFHSKINGECQPCHRTCQSCYGHNADQCLSCQPKLLLSKGTCSTTCPEDHFLEQRKMCKKCHKACSTCNGPSANNCKTCTAGMKLESETNKGTTCIHCKPRHFYDSFSNECRICHNSCDMCTGFQISDCTQCTAPLILDPWNKTCVPCCQMANQGNCCNCNVDKSNCLEPTRSDKKRSSFQAAVGIMASSSYGTGYSSTSSGTAFLLACIITTIIFASVLVIRNWKREKRRRQRQSHRDSSNVSYRKIPMTTNRGSTTSLKSQKQQHNQGGPHNSRLLQSHLYLEDENIFIDDENDDDEYFNEDEIESEDYDEDFSVCDERRRLVKDKPSI